MLNVDLENVLDIHTHDLKKAALLYRAVNHPLRQQILQLIHKKTRITVTEIYHAFDIEQSVASQQLAILRHAMLVCTKREGKQIFYSVNYDQLEFLQKQAASIVN